MADIAVLLEVNGVRYAVIGAMAAARLIWQMHGPSSIWTGSRSTWSYCGGWRSDSGAMQRGPSNSSLARQADPPSAAMPTHWNCLDR
jgi:hypothetical protein